MKTLFATILASLPAGAWAAEPVLLWVEGEKADRSHAQHNAWYDAVDPQELSGGAQIANFSEENQPGGWAEYDLQIPEGGCYDFWLRANPCTGLSWRWDGEDWHKLDHRALREEDKRHQKQKDYVPKVHQWTNVAADGKHDARSMAWYDLGPLELGPGKHTLRFSLGGDEPGTKRFAAIDCFVLTTGPFQPNYQYRPGQEPEGLVSLDPAESWPFRPERDEFSAEALFDLRTLNEDFAGQHGFIRLSADGNDFVRGDGQPIRFWGGSTYVQRLAQKKDDQGILEHHARFLAKRGVNVVRLHGAIQPKSADSAATDVDEKELDQVYRLVAAMKTAGIYTIISPYWAVQAKPRPGWGVADAGNGNCTGLLFFDPALQRAYKAWLKRIYADVNPYTGTPLAQDPAVAVIQLQNEDSMLFYTMQTVKGQALVNLRQRFGEWLLAKYGTLEKARQAWQGFAHEDDDLAAGRPGMFIVWELTRDARKQKGGVPGREARLADQAEFMGRVMYDFNREMARYLRDELGCRQLINAGNWRTADQVILDDVERWSYTANEVIGKNHYFGGVHNGLNVGWQILPGHVFSSRSFTTDPLGSPLNLRQVVGHPFIVSESLWVPPSRWQAEGPLVVAAQSCLSGLDTFFWFSTSVEEWQPPVSKWTFALPVTLGQFPAAALVFRKGYVQPSPAVVHEERPLADLWSRKLPLIAEDGAWDPNRDQESMPAAASSVAAVDPLAYLVGRVEVRYGGDPAKTSVLDLARYIDRDRKIVKSVTGQITTDLARALYQVDAPQVQAAAGFLGKAGPLVLSDVTIECSNQYASIMVVPLDERPIAASHRLLIQVGTVCLPTGWKERPLRFQGKSGPVDGSRIVDVGKSPWQVERTHARLSVRSASLSKARALDANGLPVADVPIRRDGQTLTLALPEDVLYVVLE